MGLVEIIRVGLVEIEGRWSVGYACILAHIC